MSIIDLAEIENILQWDKNDNEHKHAGVFLPLPKELANQYPTIEDDSSPKHISVIILGPGAEAVEDKVVNIISEVCKQFKPFIVKIGKVGKFINKDNEIILHSRVKSNKLIKFHDALKQALLQNQISIDNTYPNFEPHVTIAYASDRKEAKKYKDIQPEGEFVVEGIWVWSLGQPKYILLGK